MKKWLCAILATLLLLSMTACGGPSTTPESTGKTEVTNNTIVENESTEDTKKVESAEIQMHKIQFPLTTMYCMAPNTCIRKNNGRVVATSDNANYTSTIFVGAKDSYTGRLEDILTISAQSYVNDGNKYFNPDIAVDGLKADTTEKVTISGYEAVKFTGNVANVAKGTYKMYGYAMVIDEQPVMFIGFLVSEEQSDADLQAMQALVDQMAGSIAKR